MKNNWKLFCHFMMKYSFNLIFLVAVTKILVVINRTNKWRLDCPWKKYNTKMFSCKTRHIWIFSSPCSWKFCMKMTKIFQQTKISGEDVNASNLLCFKELHSSFLLSKISWLPKSVILVLDLHTTKFYVSQEWCRTNECK